MPETNTTKRKTFYMIIILLVIGITLTVAALISHFYLPIALEKAIIDEFMLNPESSSYPGWQKSNIPIYSHYYFFNITNAQDLFKPGVKPVLEEVGPYVFQLSFEKVNISWNFDNGTVEYRQVKTWIPVPSKSNGSLDDEIVHINVPLMTGIHQIRSIPEEDKFLAYESLNSLIDAFNMSFILKHKIRHLLFEGYEDDLLTTASSFYPGEVSQTKFGWLFEKNNTSSEGLFRVYTGQLDSGRKVGLIDTWNNEKENIKWKTGKKCRSFEQTTTGDLQPPFFMRENYHLLQYFGQENLLKPMPNIRMFIADICRSFDLDYLETIEYDRLRRYRYQMGPMTFNYTLEENRCYCNKSCPPNGLFDLGVCAQDSPGLRPNLQKHLFTMEFDDKFGIALKIDVKFQLNILAKKYDEIEIMADWPDNFELYLPQFWFTTNAELDESTTYQLYFLSEILPLILLLATILITLLAIICFIFMAFYIMNTRMMSWTLNDIPRYENHL
ncbi:replication factor C subunit 5-like protein [Euroglyphus maynei]|uniref:Scavenger receptor class B member 1 n=1 Tax=Euroglyphus maynei TaxID=6958 RepID=A0A1Y3BMC4_EURMA|nr:replication factor C subunit 5-like protein [Euroglyphus maynei]